MYLLVLGLCGLQWQLKKESKMNNELYIKQERERIFKEQLKDIKADIDDFRLFFQEASHCDDAALKSLYSAYTKADITGAAVDYATLGQVFAGLMNKEFEQEAENITSDRMVKEYV